MSYRKISRIVGLAAATLLAATAVAAPGSAAVTSGQHKKPTIVLVHGAFADSGGWNGVAGRLLDDGYPVVAAANPLRGVASDAAQVKALLVSIKGPVVLVGHSYGGMVISKAAVGAGNVKALVYVAGFAPLAGDSGATLSARYPGSTLGETLRPVPLPDGNQDQYVDPKLFRQQFAADVPARDAQLMALTQRPITAAALNEPAQGRQAWQSVPSYFLVPTGDKNIPAAAHYFMARRAHGQVLTVKGASHAVFVSHPKTTAEFIERAACTCQG